MHQPIPSKRTDLQKAAQVFARRRQRRTLLPLGSLPRGSRKKLDECPTDNLDGLCRVVSKTGSEQKTDVRKERRISRLDRHVLFELSPRRYAASAFPTAEFRRCAVTSCNEQPTGVYRANVGIDPHSLARRDEDTGHWSGFRR